MKFFQGKQPIGGLLLVLVLAGCSDSKEILDGSQGRTVTDEVTGALQLVILPAVEKLTAFSPVNQPLPLRANAPDPRSPSCTGFDALCRSGGFEVCLVAPDGPITYRYDRCARPGGLVDGEWTLSQDGLLATGEFDLRLDGLGLSGRIRYTLDDMCWRKEFASFRADRLDYSASIEGTLDYCLASGAEAGRLRLSVAGPGQPFELALELDASGGSAVVVREEGTLSCRFDPATGVADCESD